MCDDEVLAVIQRKCQALEEILQSPDCSGQERIAALARLVCLRGELALALRDQLESSAPVNPSSLLA
jgi:hypothetical protein